MKDRGIILKEGDMVRYVHKYDADPSETPNISPAMIIKKKEDRKMNLFVFTSSGHFNATDVPHGGVNDRGTWHRFQIGE